MKKLITFCLVMTFWSQTTTAQSCFYYVTQHADREFEVYEGEELQILFSNVIEAACDESEHEIRMQYKDALKEKYPESWFHTINEDVSGPFESGADAEIQKRKKKAKFLGDGYKIIDFSFTYYKE